MNPVRIIFCAMLLGVCAQAEEAPKLNFDEVYQLLRTNLTDISDADLKRIAAAGLLKELEPAVQLLEPGAKPEEPIAGGVTRKAIFEGAYGYIRLGQIVGGTEGEFAESFATLANTNTLKGLVLDLRYAGGEDYEACGRIVDQFLHKEKTLFRLGDKSVRSKSKEKAIDLPVAILVNRQTSGAGEVLAAALRDNEAGLVIGSRTAGRARVFETFTLTTGQKLRIGRISVELGDAQVLPREGLAPDVTVGVDESAERIWFEDPYKDLPRDIALNPAGTNRVGTASSTNRLSRRALNEAELVRRHRLGFFADAPEAVGDSQMAVLDPVLGRAIDFLKGVTVLRGLRVP